MGTTIDLRDFHLVETAAIGADVLAFSVMTDGTLRINGKLQRKIKQDGLRIRINDTRNIILLEEAHRDLEKVHTLPKNGYVKALNITEDLAKSAIKTPARYKVEWNEQISMWVGKHDEHYTFPAYCKDINHKESKKVRVRRQKNLKDMLPSETQ